MFFQGVPIPPVPPMVAKEKPTVSRTGRLFPVVAQQGSSFNSPLWPEHFLPRPLGSVLDSMTKMFFIFMFIFHTLCLDLFLLHLGCDYLSWVKKLKVVQKRCFETSITLLPPSQLFSSKSCVALSKDKIIAHLVLGLVETRPSHRNSCFYHELWIGLASVL